jgi:hypothetical protein
MATPFTEEDLLKLLNADKSENRQLDTSDIKYALYARKSTQGDEQQERSILDQVNDCFERVIIPEVAIRTLRIAPGCCSNITLSAS